MRIPVSVLAAALVLAAAPAFAAGEMTLEIVGRVTHEGRPAKDAVRLAVSTRPGDDFSAKGGVKFGRAEQAIEMSLEFRGTREEAADRAAVSVEGAYDVFFGTGGEGAEFTGAFTGAADVAPGEERILTEFEVGGDGGPGKETRIQIVLRARRP